MEEEIWEDIKGYEGLYKISNLGNVKSLSCGIKVNNLRMKLNNISYNNSLLLYV